MRLETQQDATVRSPTGVLDAISQELSRHGQPDWITSTLNFVADAIIVTYLRDKILFLNRAAEGMLGYLAPGVIGRNIRNVIADWRKPSAPDTRYEVGAAHVATEPRM